MTASVGVQSVPFLGFGAIAATCLVQRRRQSAAVVRFRPARGLWWKQAVSFIFIAAFITAETQHADATTYNPVFYYYHPNHLGSANILTDRAGWKVQHYEYGAFGQTTYTDNTSAFPISNRYTGQVIDDETGLYYYNSRYYDPQLGRFTQPDTIVPGASAPQNLNRYAYCGNNPLNVADPSGHYGIGLLIAGVIIGAAIGAASSAAQGGNPALGAGLGALGGLLGGVGGWFGGIEGGVIGGTTGATIGSLVGCVAAGAASGAAGAAITGTDVGIGAAAGAVGGVVSFGTSELSYVAVGNYVEGFGELAEGALISAAGGAVAGGTASSLSGGDFGEGALIGAASGGVGFLAAETEEAVRNSPGANSGIAVNGTPAEQAQYHQAIGYLQSDRDMAEVIRILEARGGLTINFNQNYANGGYANGSVLWNPRFALETDNGVWMSPARVLGHELVHAAGSRLGGMLHLVPAGRYTNLEEMRTILGWEDPFASRMGLGLRFSHQSAPIPYWRVVASPLLNQ